MRCDVQRERIKPHRYTHTRTHTDRQTDRQTGYSLWLVVCSDREANTMEDTHIKAKLSTGDYFGLWAPGVRIKHAPADCLRRWQNQNQKQKLKLKQKQNQCKSQSHSLVQFPIPSHSSSRDSWLSTASIFLLTILKLMPKKILMKLLGALLISDFS